MSLKGVESYFAYGGICFFINCAIEIPQNSKLNILHVAVFALLPSQVGSVSAKDPEVQVMDADPTRVFPVAHVNVQSVPWATSAPDAQLDDISGAAYVATVQSAVAEERKKDI